MIYIKKFNELTSEELYEIMRLRQEVFVLEQTCLYPDLDNMDQDCWHVIAIADSDSSHNVPGEIIGYLRILPAGMTFDTIAIGRVLVREDCRQGGTARRLLEKTLEFIRNELKKPVVKLAAQQYLTGFYKSLGFEIISEGYLEDDIPHVDMQLDLSVITCSLSE